MGAGVDFEAVIFDMDGVLVDSEIWWDDARRDWAAAHGRTWTTDDRAAVMGANSKAWARIMRDRLGLPDIPTAEVVRDIVNDVVERFATRGVPVIDGAAATVRRLEREVPLAVASSAHVDVIDAALAATGLRDAFRAIVSSDEVAHGKPAPDVYLEAARRIGVRPPACLVVEDSLNGVRSGRAAGMTVVLVPNAAVPPLRDAFELADVVLERLADLDLRALRPRTLSSDV
ncbi:MAG TPA: HAD family phosphatase [Candidatus Polarisedimenticolia bacterium]|nr:HAD family phosphatase [Candidatus Polarisedimenticolia bacterium]